MSLTMQELADLAGVSRGTVDRVLNNRGRVKEETKKRILELIKETNYSPNLAAKSLSLRNVNTKVYCILGAVGNQFFKDVQAGIQKAEHEYKYFGIRVYQTELKGFDVSSQLDAINNAVASGAGAIIINPVNDDVIRNRLNQVIASGIPVIAVSADIEDVNYYSYVGCDNFQAGRIAANVISLATDSRAKLAVVLGSPKMLGHMQRLEGIKYYLHNHYPSASVIAEIENGDDDITSYKKVAAALSAHKEVNSVLFIAGGVEGGMRALEDLGLTDQLKIVAFDLTPTTQHYLSTGNISAVINQDPFQQGYTALTLIKDLLIAQKTVTDKKHYIQLRIMLNASLQ